MLAGKLDITIEAGATWRLTLAYRQPTGAPMDLVGRTARLHMRTSVDSPDVVKALTTENGGIQLDPSDGRIVMGISATDTASMSGSGVYDLELVAGSTVERLIEGTWTVSPEVTR